MKKIIIILAVVLVISMLPAGMFAAHAEAAPEIRVSHSVAAQGDTVSLNVDFLNNPGINTYTLSVSYDSSRLSLDGATPNASLGGSFVFASNAVWFSASDTSYSGTFFTLDFTVLQDAPAGEAAVSVSYRPGFISNTNEDVLNFEVTAGGITVNPLSGVIEVGSVHAAQGSSAALDVSFLSNPGINSYTLGIEYDDSILTFTGAEAAPEFGGSLIVSRNIVWLSSSDVSLTGTFLTLYFNVARNAALGATDVTVTYRPGCITNTSEDLIDFEIIPGRILVKSRVLPGDVNGDESVDIKDVNLLKKYVSSAVSISQIVPENSDYNGDGYIDMLDIRALKKYIAGGV